MRAAPQPTIVRRTRPHATTCLTAAASYPVSGGTEITIARSRQTVPYHMALVASMLAYLGAVSGISIGLLMLLCALLTPPGQPTFIQHGRATTPKLNEPIPLKVSLSTRSKIGGRRQPPSVRLWESGAIARTSGASYRHYAARKVTLLRQESRDALRQKLGPVVSRERSRKWTYRHPNVSYRPLSYAQAPSGDLSPLGDFSQVQ